MDPGVAILAARFQKQNPVGRICRKAIGKHASGRSGSYDDVVVFAV
jgi:hypothetical protein